MYAEKKRTDILRKSSASFGHITCNLCSANIRMRHIGHQMAPSRLVKLLRVGNET